MIGDIIDTFYKLIYLFRDRPRLRIKPRLGFIMGPQGRSPMMMIVTVTNIGRRPIKLVSTGLRLSERGGDITRIPEPDEPRLPKKLDEADDFVTYFDIDGIKQELKKQQGGVRIEYGWYRDSADNLHRYKIPKGIIKRLYDY